MASWYRYSGGYINLDRVDRVVVHNTMRGEREAVFFLGEERFSAPIDEYSIDLPGALVPAAPGFFVVTLWEQGDEIHVSRNAVVAWQDDGYGGLKPRCIDSEDGDAHGDNGILCPDGRVVIPEHRICDSLGHWIEVSREDRAVMRERLKKQP